MALDLNNIPTLQSGAYVADPSATAPLNPKVGELWLSLALADADVSANLYDRKSLLAPISPETSIQEPATWTDSTHLNMAYTANGASNGICIRQCPLTADSMVDSNWTKVAGPGTNGQVIGSGNGGITGTAAHPCIFVQGSTVYCFVGTPSGSTSIVVCSTPLNGDYKTWTFVGTILTSAQLPPGATQWGNPDIFQDPASGTFYNSQEYLDSAGHWQMTQATSSTLTGSYSLINGLAPMTSLYPCPTSHTASGACVTYENGEWVMLYHSEDTSTHQTSIYRATAPSLGADNWTVQGAHDYRANPLVHAVDLYEIGQVSDPQSQRMPDGQAFLFWTGLDNRTNLFRIYGAPMLPVMKRWDGVVWRTMTAKPADGRGVLAPGKVFVQPIVADFDGTSTTFAQFANCGTGSWFPTGTDFEVALVATVLADTSGVYKFQAALNYGSTTAPMGGVYLVANQVTSIHLTAKFTDQTPGETIVTQVNYENPAAGNLYCRPVTQAGVEQGSMRITDTAYDQV